MGDDSVTVPSDRSIRIRSSEATSGFPHPTGSASLWGFAIWLASRDGYQESVLPSGLPIGAPEEALDCACGLYLNDPSAWQDQLPPAGP